MRTTEPPLVDVLTSEVTGNVERRMMEDLPVQGRNRMEPSLLVQGVTGNDTANNRPGTIHPSIRDESFQLKLDGQKITQRVASSFFDQPQVQP
jgi:hypothetical protein